MEIVSRDARLKGVELKEGMGAYMDTCNFMHGYDVTVAFYPSWHCCAIIKDKNNDHPRRYLVAVPNKEFLSDMLEKFDLVQMLSEEPTPTEEKE